MKYYFILLLISLISLFSCSKTADEKTADEKPVVNTDNKFVKISPSNNTTTLTTLWFFDALTGFVTTASSTILRTIDGGNAYISTSLNGSTYLENLYFYNSNFGFCSDPNFKAFKFTDSSWTEFSYPVKDTYASSYQMLSENQLFTTTVKGNNEFSYLVNSNNGGATWDTLYKYNGNFKKILMLNENTGFLLANSDEKIDIIKTFDSGKSWYSRLPSIYGTYFNNSIQLKDIIALDTNNIIAIGRGSAPNEGILLTSTDGGDNWHMAIIANALTSLCATETDVYFAGAELFIAKWKINPTELAYPIEIASNWIPFNRESDFLNSDKGEPVTHYHHIIQVQFVDNHTGFILTADASEIFKINLVPEN